MVRGPATPQPAAATATEKSVHGEEQEEPDSAQRKELQETLCRYITDTLTYTDTVRAFCELSSKWFPSSEDGQMKDILEGVAKLDSFLDALEKLVVTSSYVFTPNRVLVLPEGTSFEVCVKVIIAARRLCPVLLMFKREPNFFLVPSLEKGDESFFKYIRTIQCICAILEKSVSSDFKLKTLNETVVNLPVDVDVSEEDVRRMLDRVNWLDEIRMDEPFRMVCLFQEESCDTFISDFSKRQPTMSQSLQGLEEAAAQLDRMNKGAKISSVTGSSVGAAGSTVSITGLVLAPVTGGLSLALTLSGFVMGMVSAVNSVVTTTTEMIINSKQLNKANEGFKSFMKDVQSLQRCLDDVTNKTLAKMDSIDVSEGVGTIANNVGAIASCIEGIVDAASAIKVLRTNNALRNLPRLSSEIPEVGQAAATGSRGLSKLARGSLIGLNSLFLGVDIFFICKDSISLANGTETEMSQFIRERAKLWSSEMEAFQRMHDYLCKGQQMSEKNKVLLETPFYPDFCTKEYHPVG